MCPLCPYNHTANLNMKLRDYMQHIRECHTYSPSFEITCGMNGCPKRFKKFRSFKSHVYDWHGGDPNVSNTSTTPSHSLTQLEPETVHESEMIAATDSSDFDTIPVAETEIIPEIQTEITENNRNGKHYLDNILIVKTLEHKQLQFETTGMC